MKFTETRLKGAFLIEPEKLTDERGFFARAFCEKEFRDRGLHSRFVQWNMAFNRKKGTLRGMHYQTYPHQEIKLVRCTRGAVYDVIVDLRPDSPTFKKWVALELTSGNSLVLYIPKGVAHGYQTLEEDTELFYQMSEPYHPECARGLRWDDPAIGIAWPPGERIFSDRDRKQRGFVLL